MSKQLIDDKLFLPKLCDMLQLVENSELDNIEAAAKVAYRSICNGGLLHVFSCGHSHMIVEEMFYRAGGLVPINPILDNSLMLHDGAIQSTLNERKHGKAEEVLGKANLSAGDTIIISSNTGVNIVQAEAALYAKKKGLTVIAVTSVNTSRQLEAKHESGKKLYELSDIVIDTHVPMGDGLLTIPENGQITAGASTFSSLFIAQRLVLKIENLFLSDGLLPPVYMSANVPNGMEHNDKLIHKYQDKIKALR